MNGLVFNLDLKLCISGNSYTGAKNLLWKYIAVVENVGLLSIQFIHQNNKLYPTFKIWSNPIRHMYF